MTAPHRTADTMSDAIALSSPSGRMSRRAREAAQRRLAADLFGPNGEVWRRAEPSAQQVRAARIDSLRRHAARLLELADRGMAEPKYRREAAKATAQADALAAEQ